MNRAITYDVKSNLIEKAMWRILRIFNLLRFVIPEKARQEKRERAGLLLVKTYAIYGNLQDIAKRNIDVKNAIEVLGTTASELEKIIPNIAVPKASNFTMLLQKATMEALDILLNGCIKPLVENKSKTVTSLTPWDVSAVLYALWKLAQFPWTKNYHDDINKYIIEGQEWLAREQNMIEITLPNKMIIKGWSNSPDTFLKEQILDESCFILNHLIRVRPTCQKNIYEEVSNSILELVRKREQKIELSEEVISALKKKGVHLREGLVVTNCRTGSGAEYATTSYVLRLFKNYLDRRALPPGIFQKKLTQDDRKRLETTQAAIGELKKKLATLVPLLDAGLRQGQQLDGSWPGWWREEDEDRCTSKGLIPPLTDQATTSLAIHALRVNNAVRKEDAIVKGCEWLLSKKIKTDGLFWWGKSRKGGVKPSHFDTGLIVSALLKSSDQNTFNGEAGFLAIKWLLDEFKTRSSTDMPLNHISIVVCTLADYLKAFLDEDVKGFRTTENH